ncbi:sterol regulatory element-binding protein 1 [Podospora conica]|nr:sterol regulatory element-binding protein 1 [Schizothecium conicum]
MTGGSPSIFGGFDDDFNLDGVEGPITTCAGTAGPPLPTALDTPVSATASPLNDSIHAASTSPTAVDAASRSSFQFTPDTPHWDFQQVPPPGQLPPGYDPTTTAASFGSLPSWELPVHLTPAEHPHFGQHQHQQYPQPGRNFDAFSRDHNYFLPSRNDSFHQPLSPDEHLIRPTITPNIRNTLTPAQQEKLKTIAMPHHLQYQSPKSAGSPDSSGSGGHSKGGASSPDTGGGSKLAMSRKRKSSGEDDDDDDDDLDEHPVKKTAHNMIEKRYRTNLNDKIAALRDSVPSLRIMTKSARGEDTTEDREELHGLTPAHKLNKATVLSKATEYIRHLEKRNNRLLEENVSMQARISAFEKLFMAGALPTGMPQQPPTPMQYPQDAAFMSTPMGTPQVNPVPGMISVPDNMKRLLVEQDLNAGRPYPVQGEQQPFIQNPTLLRQQQIQQQQQQQAQQARGWNQYYGKMMLGSLAGIMLVEALVENEQSNDTPEGRGLLAMPVSLLSSFVRSTHFTIGGHYISAGAMIAKLRLLSLILLFGYILLSYAIDMSVFGKPEKPTVASPVVRPAPSLASPIHVRRQAWLTAIQTVWVPRHNFFLEAAALALKALKYTMRNVVGPELYLTLFRLSEEQETARVKAWATALDAQLAGGDVEINKSRLTLTLIASGTLPNSPLRLMLQALHIRVLLWQLTGSVPGAHIVAAQLARSRWNEARQLNRILHSLHSEKLPMDEELPVHLSLLLEQDCDEVFSNDVIQRAHNLAWNKPTTFHITGRIDGMDAVVDDAAVRSPMDAVAAWYSSIVLHRVLAESLPKKGADRPSSTSVATDIALAIEVAPIGSNAQVRGLVARALLVEEKRGYNIAAAIQALGPSHSPDKYPQYSRGVPPLIDSPMTAIVPDLDAQMALRCAMATAQLQKFTAPPAGALGVLDSILPEGYTHDMSLLGCAAAFHLMERLNRHAVGRETCAPSLERLAGKLRIWIGSSEWRKAGLEGAVRQRMVERCLGVTRSIVGMENDAGYASMEDSCEEEEDGC